MPYKPRRHLRSEAKGLLDEPRTRLKFGGRAFSISAPRLWNALPQHLKDSTSCQAFKKCLKTHLYRLAHWGVVDYDSNYDYVQRFWTVYEWKWRYINYYYYYYYLNRLLDTCLAHFKSWSERNVKNNWEISQSAPAQKVNFSHILFQQKVRKNRLQKLKEVKIRKTAIPFYLYWSFLHIYEIWRSPILNCGKVLRLKILCILVFQLTTEMLHPVVRALLWY